MVRTRLRHVLTGAVMEKSFRSSEKFEEPDIETVPASFLYSDAEGSHFMDEKSFEQFVFSNEAVGDDRGYLKDGLSLQILKYNGTPVSLQLPQYVELAVTSTEPGLRGDTYTVVRIASDTFGEREAGSEGGVSRFWKILATVAGSRNAM